MTERESGEDTEGSVEETSFPVREFSGLLWVWLDRSPEGASGVPPSGASLFSGA